MVRKYNLNSRLKKAFGFVNGQGQSYILTQEEAEQLLKGLGEEEGEKPIPPQDEKFVPTPLYAKDKHLATFKDICGYKDEKAALAEICDAVLALKKDRHLDGYIPKGIILSGVPGVGKTSMTEAVISRCQVPYFTIKPDEDGYSHLRATYRKAAEMAPSIVVLDDIDRLVSLGGQDGFTSDSTQNALSVLLDCLDGIDAQVGVLTIATTNDYTGLDPALVRSGRMDRHISLGLPDENSRTAILARYLGDYNVFKNVDPAVISDKTAGFSCADLKTLVNDVWLKVLPRVKKGNAVVDVEKDFQKRIYEIKTDALLKQNYKNPDVQKQTAYHEAGHAVVQYILTGRPSDLCTLQGSDSGFMGWTEEREQEKDFVGDTRKTIEDSVTICLGGRAAEIVKYGKESVTTGPSEDLELAAKTIGYGILGGVFGLEYYPFISPTDYASPFPFDSSQPQVLKSKWQQLQTDELRGGESRAEMILTTNSDLFEAVTKELVKKNILSAEEFLKIAEEMGYHDGKLDIPQQDRAKKGPSKKKKKSAARQKPIKDKGLAAQG